MAKRGIASGKSIKDIMSMSMSEFESYSTAEQREITSRLASAANKRLKRLTDSGIVNPATIRLDTSGGKISVKGKSGEELQDEFFRAKKFLKSNFSSKKEWKKFESKVEAHFSQNEKQSVNLGLAFSYYDVLEETDPSISKVRDKYKIVNKIAEYMEDGKSGKELLNSAMQYLQREYLREQESYNKQNVSFGNRIENDMPTRFKRKRKRRR